MKIKVRNWRKHQSVRSVRPAWIKLHRTLLDHAEFANLPVESRALAPLIWLIASEFNGGVIEMTLDSLAFRLRMRAEALLDALSPLAAAGFIVIDWAGEMAPRDGDMVKLAGMNQQLVRGNGATQHCHDPLAEHPRWRRL